MPRADAIDGGDRTVTHDRVGRGIGTNRSFTGDAGHSRVVMGRKGRRDLWKALGVREPLSGNGQSEPMPAVRASCEPRRSQVLATFLSGVERTRRHEPT